MAPPEKKERKNRRRWFLDFSSSSGALGITKYQDLPAPYSFSKNAGNEVAEREQNVDKELIVKRSWDVALAPIKQVPMNLFMMWMAGSSISIFPIMMVGMMAIRPIQAFLSMSQTFKMIEGEQAPLQKLSYIFGNLVAVGLSVYKCNSMGLLPTHASDWLAFADIPQRIEFVAGGMSLQ
ncbi:ER membrane protein complex subunit 4-like [Watersipora subatra]|uniref:ER membrane protein complex subunit 4-like n=1 Tax=Watersipora subatra TaxID=2589382 RepID=UPI00355BE23E